MQLPTARIQPENEASSAFLNEQFSWECCSDVLPLLCLLRVVQPQHADALMVNIVAPRHDRLVTLMVMSLDSQEWLRQQDMWAGPRCHLPPPLAFMRSDSGGSIWHRQAMLVHRRRRDSFGDPLTAGSVRTRPDRSPTPPPPPPPRPLKQ